MATGGVNAERFGRIVMNWETKGVHREYMKRLRKVTLQLFRMIIIASPVDTGRFTSNWDVATGGPPTGNPGGDHGGSASAAASAAMNNANAGLRNLKEAGVIPAWVWIGNNLPYGPTLEYVPGFTTKAEAGFVRAAVAAMESKLKSGTV